MNRLPVAMIAALAVLNIAVGFLLVGAHAELKDKPLVIAKTATEKNWEDSISQIAGAYHRAEMREKSLMAAGIVSYAISTGILLLCLYSLVRPKPSTPPCLRAEATISSNRHNDISIGDDQWITFIAVDGRQPRAVSIDYSLQSLEPFLAAMETHCVADCCGINAFSLWPKDILRARKTIDHETLASQLILLRRFIEESDSDIFVSKRLNSHFDREVLLQLVDHLRAHSIS